MRSRRAGLPETLCIIYSLTATSDTESSEGGGSDVLKLASRGIISPWTMRAVHDRALSGWEMTGARTETDESLSFWSL